MLVRSWVLAAALAYALPAGASPPDGATRAQAEALVQAGQRALQGRRFEEAAQRFERALAVEPYRLDAQLGLGDALFWLGEHERALTLFERAAAAAPGFAIPLCGIGNVYLALAERAWGRPRARPRLIERAQASFALALVIEPDNASARDGMRRVAAARTVRGQPLGLLEWVTALLLLGLCVTAVARVRRHGLPQLREYRWPLALFAGTRLVVFAAFAIAPALIDEAPSHPYAFLRDADRPVLDSVAGRWDANLYADTALEGYRLHAPGDGNWGTVGQFPLLPVLLRGLAFALDDAHWAALLIPNAALLLASCLLFSLLRAEHGERVAAGAVCVLLVHPASLHGSVLYAESLTLLGLAGLIWSLRQRALASAALWGTFAGLARLNALAIVPWLLFELWQSPHERSWRSLLARLSPMFGVLLFMTYLQLELGDGLAYFRELREHRFVNAAPLLGLREVYELVAHVASPGRTLMVVGSPPLLWFALLCFLVNVLAAAALVRERAIGPALFVGASLLLASSSNLASYPRYLWLVFPTAVWLARVCDRPLLRYALPGSSLCALFVASVAFARWYFVP